MTDHEARARELITLGWHVEGLTEHVTFDQEELVSAIASALREAEAGERREIMNLLGMDETGHGLVTVKDHGGTPVNVSHDPYYNLEGALIDLRRQGADEVCIRTIERVQAQLAEVSKRAAAIRSKTDG